MSGRSDETRIEALRSRAERAMDEGRGRGVVEPLLERILIVAPEGDPTRIFAHRHLAEFRLEEDPWAAALHLRKVIGVQPHDDVSHSLMALAQALLGNYRAAVAAYRRALSFTPKNPWYHHNLGHLLDVALEDPEAALPHLELALAAAYPPEHEIAASVAHCLARLGRLEEAKSLAHEALAAAPQNRDHRALAEWIEAGAPAGRPHLDRIRRETGTRLEAPVDDVRRLLETHMKDEGFSPGQLDRARALLLDYVDERHIDGRRAEICAAAVHYAIARVHGLSKVTQARVAERYGISPSSLSTRYGDIRDSLALTPGDPRYAEL